MCVQWQSLWLRIRVHTESKPPSSRLLQTSSWNSKWNTNTELKSRQESRKKVFGQNIDLEKKCAFFYWHLWKKHIDIIHWNRKGRVLLIYLWHFWVSSLLLWAVTWSFIAACVEYKSNKKLSSFCPLCWCCPFNFCSFCNNSHGQSPFPELHTSSFQYHTFHSPLDSG